VVATSNSDHRLRRNSVPKLGVLILGFPKPNFSLQHFELNFLFLLTKQEILQLFRVNRSSLPWAVNLCGLKSNICRHRNICYIFTFMKFELLMNFFCLTKFTSSAPNSDYIFKLTGNTEYEHPLQGTKSIWN
jgi:hypothetical protein